MSDNWRQLGTWLGLRASSTVACSIPYKQSWGESDGYREALQRSRGIFWNQAEQDAGQGQDQRFRQLLLMEEAVTSMKIEIDRMHRESAIELYEFTLSIYVKLRPWDCTITSKTTS